MENGGVAHEVCRICANFFGENSDFVAIFEDDPQLEIKIIIEFIKNELSAWQLKIMPNDGLPQRICGNCFARFCGIHSFRQECVESQRNFWQSLLQDSCLVGDGDGDGVDGSLSLQLGMTDGLGLLSSDDFLMPGSDVPMETTEVVVGDGFEAVVQDVNVATPASNAYSDIFSKNFANDNFPNEALINADSVTDSLVGVKPADVLDIVPTVPPQNLDIAEQVALAQAQDSLTGPKDIKPEIEHIEIQDLEEMLQGSIIPTIPLKDREKPIILTATPTTAITNLVPNKRTDAPVPVFIERDASIQPSIQADYNSASTATDDDEEEQEELYEMNHELDMRLSTQSLSCQYCYCSHMDASENVIFKDADELSQHFFDAHDPKLPYTCSYCSAVFQMAKYRDHHVREQHAANLPSEVCAYCKKKLRSPMEVHQYTCSYVDNWECEACGKKFFNAPLHRFRVHQRHHDPTKQFRCKICSRVFIRRVNLEAHERDHAKQSDGPLLTCDECHAVFINDYELKRHKYQMHKGEPPVRCTRCNKSFVSNAFLNRHMQNFHPSEVDGSLTVTCTNCDTTFSSVNKLRNHLQRRRDENGKCRVEVVKEPKRRQRAMNHPCSHCARRFHSLAQLERHLITHDPQQRPIQCEQCHVRCRSVSELQQHMCVAHPAQVQPFVCDICGKSFAYKKELLNHTLYHTELKHACKTLNCDFVGNNEIDLSAHVWQQHVLVPCKYCGETFIGDKLNAHMQNSHGHFETPTPNAMGVTADAVCKQESNFCSRSYNEFTNDTSSGKYTHIEMTNGHDQLDLHMQQQFQQQQQHQQQQLEEDDDSTYKSMSHSTHDDDEQMSQYFIGGNLLDSEHEIIVT